MEDTDNPYRSPRTGRPTPEADDFDDDADPRTIGKARHVPTVAILMMVHGVLVFLAGFALIGMIFFIVPQMSQQIELQQEVQRQQNPNAPQLPKEGMATLLSAVYGGMAAVLFIIGVINIVAGMQNRVYRGRVFGIISLIFSMGSILFCWLLPFSIGLLIFGLIVYLSPEADRAFRLQHAK